MKIITTAVELAALGYGPYLIPVTNPRGKIAPGSGLNPTHMGKAPGELVGEELWIGAEGWRTKHYRPEDIDAMKGNTGCRNGDIVTIDVDVYKEVLSKPLCRIVENYLTKTPCIRIGEAPKSAYLCLWDGPITGKQTLNIGSEKDKVELLAYGQQTVLLGDHATTLKPYTHPNGIPPIGELPVINQRIIDEIFANIEECLSMDKIGVSRTGTGAPVKSEEVDPESLAGPMDQIIEAMGCIPNTPETHPSRQSWVNMGIALKAATIHDPEKGFQLFLDWSAKYGDENTPEKCLQIWDSVNPHSLGADFVLSEGERFGWFRAGHQFSPIKDEAPAPAAPAPETVDNAKCRVPFSDIWLMEKLVAQHAEDIRYVRATKQWYGWGEDSWVADAGIIRSHAIGLCSHHAPWAGARAAQVASAKAVGAVSKLAEDSPLVQASVSTFDAHPDLLGVPGGIVDLRSGAILLPDRGQFISRRTSIRPKAGPTPVWDKFLLDCVGGAPHMVSYLQRKVGYCLTGRTEEHVIWLIWGAGGNGKSTYLNVLAAILGDYVATASMDTFCARNDNQHPTGIASLAGARVVLSQETKPGQRWDETLLKSLSGGDQVTARFMYGNPFTFLPAFKILFSGNCQPHLTTIGPAITRRFHIVPFTHEPPIVNKQLPEQLKEEYPAILAWAMEGARMWYAGGLQKPKEVEDATKDYMEAEDSLGRWIKECCVVGPKVTGMSGPLYKSWKDWCVTQGMSEGSMVVFAKRLTERGFAPNRISEGMKRDGIDVKIVEESKDASRPAQ